MNLIRCIGLFFKIISWFLFWEKEVSPKYTRLLILTHAPIKLSSCTNLCPTGIPK